MINKVGLFESRLNNIKYIPFKGEETQKEENKAVTNIFEQTEKKGLDALATYNYAMSVLPAVKDKMDVQPLTPIFIAPNDVEKINGEKIYSSDGKLHSITQRGENTYTVYTIDKDNDNLFSEIKTIDKKTGNILLSQLNVIEDGKYKDYYLTKYDINTQKEIADSTYEGSDLYSASTTIYNTDGSEKQITKYYKDNEYYIYEQSKNDNNSMAITLSNDKKVKNMWMEHKNKIGSNELSIDFYDGAPTEITNTKTMTIPNTIGWENFKSDNELKPAEKFKKIENIDSIKGEKTYYSNGALETNTFNSDNGKTTAYFNPDGTCYKISSEKFTVEFNDKYQTITEVLDNNKTKITTLYESGRKSVDVKDGNSYKTIRYTSKNYPSCYSEGIIEDGERKETKYLSYNDDSGMLKYGYDYTV